MSDKAAMDEREKKRIASVFIAGGLMVNWINAHKFRVSQGTHVWEIGVDCDPWEVAAKAIELYCGTRPHTPDTDAGRRAFLDARNMQMALDHATRRLNAVKLACMREGRQAAERDMRLELKQGIRKARKRVLELERENKELRDHLVRKTLGRKAKGRTE